MEGASKASEIELNELSSTVIPNQNPKYNLFYSYVCKQALHRRNMIKANFDIMDGQT